MRTERRCGSEHFRHLRTLVISYDSTFIDISLSLSIKEYSSSLVRRTTQLVQCMEALMKDVGVVDLTHYLEHWSYDLTVRFQSS